MSSRYVPHAIEPNIPPNPGGPQHYLATANADPVGATFDGLPLRPMRYSVEVSLWDASGLVVLDQASAGGIEVRLEGRAPINRPGVFEPAGGFRADGA